MADKTDIKEGAKFKTPQGRIGVAYAVTQFKIDNGIVDLHFEGGGCVVEGENYAPPWGLYNIEKLELVK